MHEYRIIEGGMHDRFRKSRAKLQLIGGGFGNGKTAAIVMKNLDIARRYPGSNLLLGRSTFPRLNDTVRKEFLKWCPPSWIKSFPMSVNASNTCTLINGTELNFRYVQQGGKNSGESTTSNLLSATYDMATIDQIEDPEIAEKDFNDVLGRLRGNTLYQGDDKTMPRTGPRWFLATCNPTANWVFQKLVRPYKVYEQTGVIQEDLFCRRDPDSGKPMLNEQGEPILLMELFEASTYENKHNLGEDFIHTLEAQYKGQFRDRYLLGQWASYEGLVYPEYNDLIHGVTRQTALNYLAAVDREYNVVFIEGFDFGIASPSCYLLAFVDNHDNVIVIDGFYEKEKTIDQLKAEIWRIRTKYGVPHDNAILADPDIFRRKGVSAQTVGETISGMFFENPGSIMMMRGNNDIMNGITKITSYLATINNHKNPFTGDYPAPRLYVVNDLRFFQNEITSYYWEIGKNNERVDKPTDRNDHAMDALKYLMTYRPDIAGLIIKPEKQLPAYMHWHEEDVASNPKRHRYG